MVNGRGQTSLVLLLEVHGQQERFIGHYIIWHWLNLSHQLSYSFEFI